MNLTSVSGICIAVVGAKNTGKKSLLKALQATPIHDNIAILNNKGKRLLFSCVTTTDIAYGKTISSAEFAIVVLDASRTLCDEEFKIFADLKKINIPFFAAVNKIECGIIPPLLSGLKKAKVLHYEISCKENAGMDRLLTGLVRQLPEDKSSSLLENVLYAGDSAVLVAPKLFDSQPLHFDKLMEELNKIKIKTAVIQEHELKPFISSLQTEPDLVVCESESVREISSNLAHSTRVTSYGILNCCTNSTLSTFISGLKALETIKDGNNVLISEGCMSHPQSDKVHKEIIPAWLKKNIAKNITITICSSYELPENISEYKLVIHCKGCNLSNNEIKTRINLLRLSDIPVINTEILRAYMHGAIPRVILPFNDVLTTLAEIQMFPGFLPPTHF